MLNFLCLTNTFKGNDFIRACKAEGNKVYLVTSINDKDKPWAKECLDDIFFLQKDHRERWDINELVNGLAHFMQHNRIDRVVALDDFDVEHAAHIREHFRIPGMGETTCRFFRDKLAMRMQAKEMGIPVPAFTALFYDSAINAFIKNIAAPWVLKPRSEASADGIRKIEDGHQLWQAIHALGNRRHHYLVEQFKPGAVYHADALTVNGKVIFCRTSQYLNTPFEVAHGGGIFRSQTCEFGGKDDKALQKLNAKVMKAFGMRYSASHTEFIKNEADGKFYFLETSCRVGGAHLAEMVEASSGINLWKEWAKLETAIALDSAYEIPTSTNLHAGIVVSLSRYPKADYGSFTDKEIVWTLDKEHHIGMIVKSEDRKRVSSLLDDYAHRINEEFHASAPGK